VLKTPLSSQIDTDRLASSGILILRPWESGKIEAERKYDEITNKHKNDYYVDKSEFDFFQDLLKRKKMEKQAEEYRQITTI